MCGFSSTPESDSRVKILSSPSVLATDNRPARIQVGSEEPIATGQVVGATGAATIFKYHHPISQHRQNRNYYSTGQFQGLVNLQTLVEVSQRGAPVTVGTRFISIL